MKKFIDVNGNEVALSFSTFPFKENAKHVLVICQYHDSWFLTHHKTRGIEFPGGKVDIGESLEDAARREVYEETGAILADVIRIGEYRVSDPKGAFVKAVFWSQVKRIENRMNYFETNGPITINGDILQLRFGKEYSFIMKDMVIEECIKKIDQLKAKKSREKLTIGSVL